MVDIIRTPQKSVRNYIESNPPDGTVFCRDVPHIRVHAGEKIGEVEWPPAFCTRDGREIASIYTVHSKPLITVTVMDKMWIDKILAWAVDVEKVVGSGKFYVEIPVEGY